MTITKIEEEYLAKENIMYYLYMSCKYRELVYLFSRLVYRGAPKQKYCGGSERDP